MADQLTDERLDRFRVEPWVDWLGGIAARRRGLLRRVADIETRRMGDALDGIEIRAPIFVCGLARSGSTILLECLAAHRDTASHRYRDYPGVLAPIVWDQIAGRLYANRKNGVERAHGDGIIVTPDSPEAIEEMVWMAFYPHAHDPARDNRIGRNDVSQDFAAFYRDHIRKVLWLRGGRRYLSKENYNVARLGGLLALFPDARFIVPVRDPVTHIASLMGQHALFSAAQTRHPAALRYTQRVGHFEFGLDRRPLNLGDGETTAEVLRLWREGDELTGWCLYWANLHEALARQLSDDAGVAAAVRIVRFEDLCADPGSVLGDGFDHAGLAMDPAFFSEVTSRIRTPDPRTPFNDTERQTIRRLTAPAAQHFGY